LTKKRIFHKKAPYIINIFGDFMAVSEKVTVIELNDKPEYQRLLAGQPQTYGMRAGRVYLDRGKSCGSHSTKENEEILVFLSGRGELLIADKNSYQIGEGKVCYIPPQTIHDVKNTGSEPLVYIYCVAPTNSQSGENDGIGPA
jgi:mannose-6-phosphate isomerase-like protein (cupin superfamily)